MTLDNVSGSSGHEICNLFATHFSSVFNGSEVQADADRGSNFGRVSILFPLSSVNFEEEKVLDSFVFFSHLLSFYHTPSDGIPTIFAKACASELSEPLTVLSNLSLSSGIFPDE